MFTSLVCDQWWWGLTQYNALFLYQKVKVKQLKGIAYLGSFFLIFRYDAYNILIITVGVATRYGLDGSGIDSRRGRDIPIPFRRALGTNSASYTVGTVFL